MPSTRSANTIGEIAAPAIERIMVADADISLASEFQLAIFHWFRTGDIGDDSYQHLIVRARAGTGKTWTLLRALMEAPERRILLLAFMRRIMEEMKSKLADMGGEADVRTAHSLGYRAIIRQLGRISLLEGKQRFAREDMVSDAISKGLPFGSKRLIAKMFTKARELYPVKHNLANLVEMAYNHDLIPEPDSSLTVEQLARATANALEYGLQPHTFKNGIDHADQIFLPLALNLLHPEYDMVIGDEAQDFNEPQLDIMRRSVFPYGRIVLVGDDRQCQPGETRVQTEDGERALSSLQPGDTVVSWDRHASCFIKAARVNAVVSRPYRGSLYTVRAGGYSTRCTPNHKWVVRWASQPTDAWILYLMRRGQSFRVGQCKMFRESTHGMSLGLNVRANQEGADDAWILTICDSKDEALIQERIVSARYGIPELCFEGTNHSMLSKAMMDAVWAALGDMTEAGVRCLSAYGKDAQYPFLRRNDRRLGRQTLFETEAVNLISGYMAIPVAPAVHEGFDKPQRRTTRWAPLLVEKTEYSGLVYSLDVARHHKYVADGLVTCNSIFRFRGADGDCLDRLKRELGAAELPLSRTYRCPQSVVALAKQYVPDYEADPSNPEGIISRVADSDELIKAVGPGDFVLSRRNAPLAKLALHTLRAGKPAKIQGRDIGNGLKALIRQLAKGDAARSIPAFLSKLDHYADKMRTRLQAAGHEEHIEALNDKVETLKWLAEDATGVPGLTDRIENLFTDEPGAAVIFSTVHKAKGLETNRVFILESTFGIPIPCECGHRHYAKGCARRCGCTKYTADRKKQLEEQNIKYVAITRCKRELTWADGDYR